MYDGVSARLADHEICPLNDDNGHEKRRVTGKLEHLALSVRLQKQRYKNVCNTRIGSLAIVKSFRRRREHYQQRLFLAAERTEARRML